MDFDNYWDQGGASQFRNASSSDIKEDARAIWNVAQKYGRTDNNFVDLSFPEFWNEEGIGEDIDEKNRGRWIFKIDKSAVKEAMREIWDDAVMHGSGVEKGKIGSTG